jgi:alanyl-tRNA synthetase
LGFDLAGGAISTFARPYADDFSVIKDNWYPLKDALNTEAVKFNAALTKGSRKLKKLINSGNIDGKLAFDLYQSDGFPLDLTLEMLEENGIKFSKKDKEMFESEFEKHKDKSRTASVGRFKGGLADHSDQVVRFHTATHLLQAALRKVLGDHVEQRGQNITKERSRYDFSHDTKLTDKELKQVVGWVNDKIEKDIPVKHKIMDKNKAEKVGAVGLFAQKYGDKVNVYFVGESLDDAISKEFCGGPHVAHTGEIGRVRIKKQEKLGSNLVRIYMTSGDEN